jgi:RNA polymerase sigma-70 factor, ECF subfamily
MTVTPYIRDILIQSDCLNAPELDNLRPGADFFRSAPGLEDRILVSPDTHDDAALMSLVRAGNLEAFDELVRRHQRRVLTLAYRIIGRWDLAEDAAQEVFLHVYRAVEHYEPQAKFSTWLYRITVNACQDLRRKAARRPALALSEVSAPPSADQVDTLEVRERADLVRRAVEELPERQRIAVILHRYDGLSHQEIAEVTGWSVSAVESCLVRAYARLRERLGGFRPR